jgi:hypothetical protein
MGFNGERVDPWFHSGQIADSKNPLEFIYPDKFITPLAQWQGADSVPLIYGPPSAASYMHPELYKTPAQLRAAAAAK